MSCPPRFTALRVRVCPVLLQVGGTGLLSANNISDINGLLFFQNLFMSFGCMFQAILTFPADFQMLIKERQSGMYRLSAYYFARMIRCAIQGQGADHIHGIPWVRGDCARGNRARLGLVTCVSARSKTLQAADLVFLGTTVCWCVCCPYAVIFPWTV